MGRSMHKDHNRKNRLWIMNIDHALDKHTTNKGFLNILTKYMMLVEPNDKFIVLPNIGKESLSYVTKTRKLIFTEDWAIQLKNISNPFDTIDSIMNDSNAVSKLKELSSTNSYFIEPYIPSLKLLTLSNVLGIPLSESGYSALENNNYIKLNDKYLFKKLSEELGVRTINYSLASTKDELNALIKSVGKKYNKLIIKKTFSTGGYGNLCGKPNELISLIDDWYHHDELVLVEPFVDIEETLGSLAYVDKEQYHFIGIDKQNIKAGGWKGCEYPYFSEPVSSLVEELTIRYAKYMLKNGIEGYLNLDWAVVRENGEIVLYALENNYRYNGFSFVLDLAKKVFGLCPKDAVISYDSWYELSSIIKDNEALSSKIDHINRLFSESNVGGAVRTNMLKQNKVELMLVTNSQQSMGILKDLTRSLLAA